MFLKKRNFRKQMKSKQTVFGAMTLAIVMIIATITFSVFLITETKADFETQSASDYLYYKRIIISSSFINDSCVNFPMLIHDDTGDLQGKVQNNFSDIAFYDESNTTQFNHEIENYSIATGHVWAWVNITSLPAGSDTIIYMYYGDADGGYGIGHNPANVWDVNYLGVYHMNESTGTTLCHDSTSNYNHGTYNGSLPNLTTGKCANAQGLDGDSDYMFFTDGLWLVGVGNDVGTVEGYYWLYTLGGGNNQMLYQQDYTDADESLSFYADSSNQPQTTSYTDATFQWNFKGTTVDGNFSWYHYICSMYLNDVDLFINGSIEALDATSPTPIGDNTHYSGITIGIDSVGNSDLHGLVDEVRISNTKRNDTWCELSYHSTNQSSGLVTLGAEQEQGNPSVYTIKGLTDNRVTWAGTAGNAVWTNTSGDYHEWLEINMSVNASENATDILVYMGDLNNTNAWINASNITLYCADYTNGTYYDFGSYTDGGSNISLNKTTWGSACAGGFNPFNSTGVTNCNTSIFCIFRTEIPSGLGADTFMMVSSTACKVYIGHYV